MPGWELPEWRGYHGACREFLLGLGNKFVAMWAQASVFAAGACATLATLREKQMISSRNGILIAITVVIPLLVHGYFLRGYAKQIEGVGSLMGRIEENHLGLSEEEGVLRLLRTKRYVLFGKPWIPGLSFAYCLFLSIVVVAVAAW